MATELRIVLAQLDLQVGNISGNLSKMIDAAKSARDVLHADLIVFPELSITGYPPGDLLLRPAFLDQVTAALYELKNQVQDIYCLVGHPLLTPEGLFNACSLLYNGEIIAQYRKRQLPNYGVFDEARYFTPGKAPCVVTIKDIPVGILICEDIWIDDIPLNQTIAAGAKLLLLMNASPYDINKHKKRTVLLTQCVQAAKTPLVYVNNVGGQDDLIFDGDSMLVDQTGAICQHAGFFHENLLPVDLSFSGDTWKIARTACSIPSREEMIYQALVLGVRDYLQKNHFKGAIIGVSGGIDSALTLAIAVDALGKHNVSAVMLPSRFTSPESLADAESLARNLGVNYKTITIEPAYTALLKTLGLPDTTADNVSIVEQNLQARARAIILMALANETGRIVLTTSNRSESAMGYTTLYGDMAGGLAVLKDVPKTLVYQLSHYRNQIKAVIPQRIIDRPPTAELAPGQKDEDSLPPYAILDPILEYYIDQELGIDAIVDKGFDEATVRKVVKLIYQNQYKRYQAPVGLRINYKSFDRDFRYPVSNGYEE